mgnify:CR=1 FL=1
MYPIIISGSSFKIKSFHASNNSRSVLYETISLLSTSLISLHVFNTTQLFKYGFESVIYSPLALIRGSDLYTDAAREKYKFKPKYVLIERSVSEVEGELFFEYDESPVESSSYDETQYWNMHMASIFVYMTCRGGYYKELFRHALNSDITFRDIFLEIKDNKDTIKLGYKKIIISKYNKFNSKDFNIEILKCGKIEEVFRLLF